MKRIKLSSSELKVFWDTYEKDYSSSFSMNFLSGYINMLNVSSLNSNPNLKSILELACGPGNGLNFMSFLLKGKKVNLYGTDISTNMLKNAYNTLSLNKEIALNYIEKNSDKNSLISVNNVEKLTVNLLECDNEHLVFNDRSFDAVLSNYSLHLVTNPENMIKESSRVLTDNGVACFTIWGRPENSPIFTLIPNALKKFNVPLPDLRSNFHLSKIEMLKDLILSNGFKKIYSCYSFCPTNIYTIQEYNFMINSPNYKATFENLDDSTRTEVINEIENQLNEILNGKNQFFGSEEILLLCKKNE